MKFPSAALGLLVTAGAYLSGADAEETTIISPTKEGGEALKHLHYLNMAETLAAVGATPLELGSDGVPQKKKNRLTRGGTTNRGRRLDSSSSGKKGKKGSEDGGDDDGCPKSAKDLDQFPQWNAETGYWIGDYTLLVGDGTVRVSDTWPYPYGAYSGFITGNISGGSYRQRNVFLYPPNTAERCSEISGDNPLVIGPGEGVCSVNGNSLVFSADQSGCSADGSISFDDGMGGLTTTTELVGADNALLYQVFIGGIMIQSQLTTIHGDATNTFRTRTAQSFDFLGNPAGTSYYRERKVTEEVFYEELEAKIAEYNILFDDLCTKDGFGGNMEIEEYLPRQGIATCRFHLEQSFEL